MEYKPIHRPSLFLSFPWWFWFLIVDFYLVVATVLIPHLPASYPKLFLAQPFNLGVEMTIGAWWAGIGFLIPGFAAFVLALCRTDGTRLAWAALSMLFLALFCDEVGAIHERIGPWSKLYPFAIVAVALLTYALIVLFRRPETRRTASLVLTGFFLFGTVVIQESLEHRVDWPRGVRGLRRGIEEGTELAGTLAIIWGVLLQRPRDAYNSLVGLTLKLTELRNIRGLILAGLALHLTASFVLPQLIDFERRGSPLVLYPVALYFLLLLVSLRHYLLSSSKNRRFIFLLLLLALSSMGSMYNFLQRLPAIGGVFPQELNSAFFALHLIQVIILSLVILMGSIPGKRKSGILLAAVIISLFLGLGMPTIGIQAALSGIIAWLVAMLIYPEIAEEHAELDQSTVTSNVQAALRV